MTPLEELFWKRAAGYARCGETVVRDFDRAMVERTGAIIDADKNRYFLEIAGVEPAPGMPGIPVTFVFPEDGFQFKSLPLISVARDSLSPAQQRYHPGAQQYRIPSPTSRKARVPGVPIVNQNGYDWVEVKGVPIPYDIAYSVTAIVTRRGGLGQADALSILWRHLARCFPPQGALPVTDSLGDTRTYEMTKDDESMMDENIDIARRYASVLFSVRVEASLDLTDPTVLPTASRGLTRRFQAR